MLLVILKGGGATRYVSHSHFSVKITQTNKKSARKQKKKKSPKCDISERKKIFIKGRKVENKTGLDFINQFVGSLKLVSLELCTQPETWNLEVNANFTLTLKPPIEAASPGDQHRLRLNAHPYCKRPTQDQTLHDYHSRPFPVTSLLFTFCSFHPSWTVFRLFRSHFLLCVKYLACKSAHNAPCQSRECLEKQFPAVLPDRLWRSLLYRL